jgi:hypothetical protein
MGLLLAVAGSLALAFGIVGLLALDVFVGLPPIA